MDGQRPPSFCRLVVFFFCMVVNRKLHLGLQSRGVSSLLYCIERQANVGNEPMNPVTGTILQRLASDGAFVSGAQLCQELQMTRSAVWKHIVLLRELGYEIEAVTGLGYRLAALRGIPNAAEVDPLLTTRRFGRHLVFLKSTDSTNLFARAHARQGGQEGAVVIADSQSGGRGRMNRTWVSPPGVNLYCSLVLRPAVPSMRVPEIPLLAAAAIHKALINSLPDFQPLIKWPNDILVRGRKVCGILCEMESEPDMAHFVVVGFGINVNLDPLPEELGGTATSILLETGIPASRARLLAEILNQFERLYDEWFTEEDLGFLLPWFERYSWLNGKEVTIEQFQKTISGRVTGLSREGQLMLQRDDGTVIAVSSGEAHLRNIHNKITDQ